MKKVFIGFLLLSAIIFAIYFYSNKNIAETCSPVGEETICTQFQCKTGSPLATFGGAGACSDGSDPVIIKNWSK